MKISLILAALLTFTTATLTADDETPEQLQKIINSPDADPAEKQRASYRLEQMLRNAPGTVAPDCRIMLKDGTCSNLASFFDRTTVLIFYDPDCEDCALLINGLSSDAEFCDDVSNGAIRVVAIFPDFVPDAWNDPRHSIPESWTDAMVAEDFSDKIYDLYDIPGTPSVFVVNAEGRITMKHPLPEEILNNL